MFECCVCSSEKFHIEYVNEIFQINEKFHLAENIPATVCSRCGEEIFNQDTTEQIRVVLHGESKPFKSISVDVFLST
jgi:HTH-type transcriptional regulator / antitoxin MqsA